MTCTPQETVKLIKWVLDTMYKGAALSPIVVTIYICLVDLSEDGTIGIFDWVGVFNIIIVGSDEHFLTSRIIF